jgi:hypothetical protein
MTFGAGALGHFIYVTRLLVTHYITFVYLLKHRKGNEWLRSSPSSTT